MLVPQPSRISIALVLLYVCALAFNALAAPDPLLEQVKAGLASIANEPGLPAGYEKAGKNAAYHAEGAARLFERDLKTACEEQAHKKYGIADYG